MEGHTRNWHQVLEFGARLALGGPAIGAAIGLAGAFVLGYVINDALVEVSLTVLLAFSTFALCEATRVKVRFDLIGTLLLLLVFFLFSQGGVGWGVKGGDGVTPRLVEKRPCVHSYATFFFCVLCRQLHEAGAEAEQKTWLASCALGQL